MRPGASSSTPSATPTFVPLTPARILDTRSGREPAAESNTTVLVTGRGGVPASGVAAVMVNVTAVGPARSGFLTTFTSGTSRPSTSTLNYAKGQTIANQAIVRPSSAGGLSLFTSASAHLLVDVTGYYPIGAAYNAVTPTRLLDTRSLGEPLADWTTMVAVAGHGGVPSSGVAAVVVNVTAVDPARSGYVSAYSAGSLGTDTSTLDYSAGQTVAGMAIVGVDAGADNQLRVHSSASAYLLVDLIGWIPSTGDFVPLTPARMVDTRSGLGAPRARVPAGRTVTVQVTGRSGVPVTGAAAVEVNLTAVAPSSRGYLSAYPAGSPVPSTSTVNYSARGTIANSAALKLSSTGQLTVRSSASTDLLLDIVGYFSAPTDTPRAALTWSATATVDPLDPREYSMRSVSCPTSTFCAAVDDDGNALTYDGTTWTTPTRVDAHGGLLSVSCPTPTFCAAVSFDGHAVTYNGSTWSAPATIDTVTNSLDSVSCPTTTFCVAVDDYDNTVTYNGTTWTAPKRTSSPEGAGLLSVSCPTKAFCVALDETDHVVAFNGSTWTAKQLSDFNGGNLRSVSCPTTRFCAAVDFVGSVFTFDGTSWSAPTSIDPHPNNPSYEGMRSVSCPTSTFCAAVDSTGHVLTYDGGSWSAPTSIDPTGGNLWAVSCATSSFCAAVNSTGQVLIGRA